MTFTCVQSVRHSRDPYSRRPSKRGSDSQQCRGPASRPHEWLSTWRGDAVADGRVTGRHRLTIDADLLSQPSGDARLRSRELDAFGADAAVSTQDPALPGRSLPRPSTPREIPTARGS